MIQYQYIIKPLAQRKIRSFYNNVAKKYLDQRSSPHCSFENGCPQQTDGGHYPK